MVPPFTRDELEVFLVFWVVEVHLSQLLIVGCNFEWDHLKLGQTWGHLEYLCMCEGKEKKQKNKTSWL